MPKPTRPPSARVCRIRNSSSTILAAGRRRPRRWPNPGTGPSARSVTPSEAGRVSVLAGIGAADERLALDEDRLPAAEGEGVVVSDDGVAEALEALGLRPEPLF